MLWISVACLFLAVICGLGVRGTLPLAIPAVYVTASLIAMAVYLLLGWIINRVLELVMAPKTPPMY